MTRGVQQLALIMQRKKWTHDVVAARVGVSRPYLTMILSGSRQPSLAVASRLQREFKIPATWFLREAA